MSRAADVFESNRRPVFDADPFPGDGSGTIVTSGLKPAAARPSSIAELAFESDQRSWTPEQQALSAADPVSRAMLRSPVERVVIVSDGGAWRWGRGGDVACRLIIRIAKGQPFRFALTGHLHAFEQLGIPVRVQYGVDCEPIQIDKLPPGSNGFACLVGDSAAMVDGSERERDGYYGAGDPGRYEGEVFSHLIESFPIVHVREIADGGLIPDSCLMMANGIAAGRCAIVWAAPESFDDWCYIVDQRPGAVARVDAWPRGRSATFCFEPSVADVTDR